jgi:pimeloyl-ACP methyl ester carboxylesterase
MRNIVYVLMILHFANIANAQTNSNAPTSSYPCTTIEVVVHDTLIHIHTVPPPWIMIDSDGDGISDDIENAACTPPVATCDTDNDGIPNRQDLDSDNDGNLDRTEGSNDLDGDGKGNAYDTDSDGDGVEDLVDQCPKEFGVPPLGCSETFDYRNVFWVHGYQGNENSWSKASDDVGKFEVVNLIRKPKGRFKALSHKADYNISQQSLDSSAANLKSDIENRIIGQLNTSKNFVIAHSLGGLVSRTLGNMNNPVGGRAYNGLITFGTPHQGVYAANTLVNTNKVNDVLLSACKSLGKGPGEEAITNSGALASLGVLIGLAGGALSQICDGGVAIGYPLLPKFAGTGIEGQLTTDAAQSIPPMATDNNAVFYGIESTLDSNGVKDDGLTPRFIGSTLFNPNGAPLYGAEINDALGFRVVAKSLNFYTGKMNFYQSIHNIICQSSPLCLSTAGRLAKAYRQGVNWFPTLDPTWKDIIGAGTYEVEQTGCQCVFYEGGHVDHVEFYPGTELDCTDYEQEGYFKVECTQTVNFLEQNTDSDGFVLKSSAINAPGMNYPPQVMIGSNHFQMRNDRNTGDAVRRIFVDGLDRPYFQTDFR